MDLHSTSSIFLQMTESQVQLLSTYTSSLSTAVTSLHSAAQQVSSHNYNDGHYTEQEIAVYEHEDVGTRRVLRAEIEVQRQQVQELERQLEMMETQMEMVISLAGGAADPAVSCGDETDLEISPTIAEMRLVAEPVIVGMSVNELSGERMGETGQRTIQQRWDYQYIFLSLTTEYNSCLLDNKNTLLPFEFDNLCSVEIL